MNRNRDREIDEDGLDLPPSVRAQMRRFERSETEGLRGSRRRARARKRDDEWCGSGRWRDEMD